MEKWYAKMRGAFNRGWQRRIRQDGDGVITVKLTPAQRSAIECAGLDIQGGGTVDDEDVRAALLFERWDGANRLTFEPSERDTIRRALWDASNSEDATAEESNDSQTVRFARGAIKALSNLDDKVRSAS